MPTKNARYIYWDGSIFVSYLKEEPEYIHAIESIWDSVAENPDSRIVTASLSIAEASHIGIEKTYQELQSNTRKALDDMWRDPVIHLVEMHRDLMFMARDLMRDATRFKLGMRPLEAMHLAAALWVDKKFHTISEIHSTRDRMQNYEKLLAIPIKYPERQEGQQIRMTGLE